MALPPEGSELIPSGWQIIVGGTVGLTTVLGVAWKFLKGLNTPEPPGHVILERADLADLRDVREMARAMRPALEQLVAIDSVTRQQPDYHRRFEGMLSAILEKLDRMERDALVAKEVRETLARRTERMERAGRFQED